METSNIIRLSIAVVVGYLALFAMIWIFRVRKNSDKKKKE